MVDIWQIVREIAFVNKQVKNLATLRNENNLIVHYIDALHSQWCILIANFTIAKFPDKLHYSRIISFGARVMGKLIDYAEVRSGHPFRGSVPEVIDGFALTIQMRDVDEFHGVAWNSLARTSPRGRKKPDWLHAGDILFLARGAHNYALVLDQVSENVICSQYFFVIRVTDERILPAFLAWQINQTPAQTYLRKNAEGSDQQSIRRSILEAVPMVLPSLEQQRELLRLTQTAHQERLNMERMICIRAQQIEGIVSQVLASMAN